jgi:DNA-binding MarR family transcriptional regulator
MEKTNSPHKGSSLYRLILETRKLFHVLAQASSELNRESGISVSMRAVMESLYPDAELTVPEIARQKKVTRQHIQQIVNELSKAGLAESFDNPAHKRSLLIKLTPGGVAQFGSILKREQQLFKALSDEFDDQQLAQTADGLQSVRDYFSSEACQALLESLSRK